MNSHRPLERLEPLLASFAASDLTHFELRDGEFAVELVRRNPTAKAKAAQAAAVAAQVPDVALSPKAAAPPSNELIVRAEMVGIIRMSKPIVLAGAHVDTEREIASIEALGVKTPVRSSVPGTLTRVLVTDGDAVDYGQALFVVERV